MVCKESGCLCVAFIDFERAAGIILLLNLPTEHFLAERNKWLFFVEFRKKFVDVCVVTASGEKFWDSAGDIITLETIILNVFDARRIFQPHVYVQWASCIE